MRVILLVGGVGVVVVGVVALYVHYFARGYFARRDEIDAAFVKRADDLRALDGEFAFKAKEAHLEAKRFAAWLEVRSALTETLERRFVQDSKNNYFHAKETRNIVLLQLREELTARKMSLKEYRAIANRWQAILARGELEELVKAWKETVQTESEPYVLPLPEPAKDAGEEERALVKRHAQLLEKTLLADLLTPLLAEISKSEE